MLQRIAWAGMAAGMMMATPVMAAAPVTGRWLTENDEALVEIAPCGKALCGRIRQILRSKPGARTVDAANPDPALRDRPLVGTAILRDLVDSGDSWKGRIYNPESGKSYNAKVRRNPDGTLKVEGCVSFICKGPTWAPAR